jgi:hypothetical protein
LLFTAFGIKKNEDKPTLGSLIRLYFPAITPPRQEELQLQHTIRVGVGFGCYFMCALYTNIRKSSLPLFLSISGAGEALFSRLL